MFADTASFIEFERSPRRGIGNLNLTPLIDVLFILIIFFMLTTSFMRIESLELVLPSAAGNAADKESVVHLFLSANGDLAIGKRKVDHDALSETLARLLEKDANTKIMLLTADGVNMQQMVNVMDRINAAGGKSLLVRKWENAPQEAKKQLPPPPEEMRPVEVKVEAVEVPVKPAVKAEIKAPAKTKYVPDIRELYGY